MTEENPDDTAPVPPPDDTAMVLLVDDQIIVGEAVRRALAGKPNLDFHFCNDPSQAIETAQRIKPTVILQDLVMPGVDGLTLVREYRAHPETQNIPVIVLSTKEEPAIKSAAFQQGANDYLVKLPDPIELLARVRYHSKAYLSLIQRDAAHRALRESQRLLLEVNAELQRLSNADGLTGLSNRRYFDEFMTFEWKRAARERTTLSLLMIDVDSFKRYNDTYGHLAGDGVLKKVAATIKSSIGRPADLAARFGGEEFSVVMPNTALAGAQYLAEKMCRGVENLQIPHSGATSTGYVTISIGVAATIPPHDQPWNVLVKAADGALYEAKKTGRNRVVIHEIIEVPEAAAERNSTPSPPSPPSSP
jgi:two-component system, chemotaxis family, response regulator WspR